jgi:hypothetical protein
MFWYGLSHGCRRTGFASFARLLCFFVTCKLRNYRKSSTIYREHFRSAWIICVAGLCKMLTCGADLTS